MAEKTREAIVENYLYPNEPNLVFAKDDRLWLSQEFHSEWPDKIPCLTFKDAKGRLSALLLDADFTERLKLVLTELQNLPKQPPIPKK